MDDYKPVMSFLGEGATGYDAVHVRGDEKVAVDFLERQAAEGAALEFAIGTGRIALPLAERGVRVDGIELSPDMVAELRKKPGGADLDVTLGDFADVRLGVAYSLVYVVFNTFYNLLTQDEQVSCFENAAAHLGDNGCFVIEAFTPNWLYRLENQQYVHAEKIGLGEVRLDVARHDPIRQILDESHVSLSTDGIRLNPIVTRYAWPSELDLMARLAGLRLAERWGGWSNEPFTPDSDLHVSVYRPA